MIQVLCLPKLLTWYSMSVLRMRNYCYPSSLPSEFPILKILNESTFWPSNPTSGNISEGTQNANLKEHKHLYVHCSIIYTHQDVEAAQVSFNRWVDKTTMGHLHNGMLIGHKKEENVTLCTIWMDLENIVLSEISKSEKDKYHMISLMCGI